MRFQQTVYIEPVGGLGNRMRTIAAAYALSKKFCVPLVVLWKKDSGLNCRFDRLFQRTDYFKVKEIKSKFELLYYRISNKIFLGKYDNNATWKRHIIYEQCLAAGWGYYLKSFNQFYPPISFDILKPIDELLEKAKLLLPNVNKNLCGVHIRRTDKEKSIKVSSIECFESMILEQIQKFPDTIFYLSTDSHEIELYFAEKFPEKIIFQKSKELSRNTEKGIVNAMIDMICLSRCKLILGSYCSSFSDVASWWGEKSDLRIIGID